MIRGQGWRGAGLGEAFAVKPGEQHDIIPGHPDAGFAPAGMAPAESKRDLLDGADVAAHEDFEQQFEARFLKKDAIEAAAADQKKSRERVVHADAMALQRPRHPDGRDRKTPADRTKPARAAAASIAAGDGEVVAFQNGGKQPGQELGRMLQVGIHHAEDFGIAALPAVQDRSGEAAFAAAHHQANPAIGLGCGGNKSGCSITAIIINDQDFIEDFHGIERRPDAVKKRLDVRRLIASGEQDDEFVMVFIQHVRLDVTEKRLS